MKPRFHFSIVRAPWQDVLTSAWWYKRDADLGDKHEWLGLVSIFIFGFQMHLERGRAKIAPPRVCICVRMC